MVSPWSNDDLWLENDTLRSEIRWREQRLADMVQCLFGEILDSPVDRPESFSDSLHKLSVLKRKGAERIKLLLRALEKATKERDQSIPNDEGIPNRWRILEWTGDQRIADSISALFRYSGEPRPEIVPMLHKLAQLNDDLAHGRKPMV